MQYTSARGRVHLGPHKHTHAYLGTGFPQHHALKGEGSLVSLHSATLTFTEASGCTEDSSDRQGHPEI